VVTFSTTSTTAVQASDPAMTIASTIQSELGVFVYPKGDQDSATQAKGKGKGTVECYESPKQRSGIITSAALGRPSSGRR
jgi:hypothetical protein